MATTSDSIFVWIASTMTTKALGRWMLTEVWIWMVTQLFLKMNSDHCSVSLLRSTATT